MAIARDELAGLAERLPHGPGFRFVSAMVEVEPGVRGVGEWRVTGAEDFFAGHFPGEPLVPGVLLAEALAQVAGIVAFGGGERGNNAVRARLARVDVKFVGLVRPPANIRLEAALEGRMGGLVLCGVRAEVGGAEVALGRITLAG
ncbi:3-hydroxyacyl-ACP dehydratase FabZ [soil metagenome]